jgi:hypothetical protein
VASQSIHKDGTEEGVFVEILGILHREACIAIVVNLRHIVKNILAETEIVAY